MGKSSKFGLCAAFATFVLTGSAEIGNYDRKQQIIETNNNTRIECRQGSLAVESQINNYDLQSSCERIRFNFLEWLKSYNIATSQKPNFDDIPLTIIDTNEAKQSQTISNKGLSLTGATAFNLLKLNQEQRDELIQKFFGELNLNTVKINIGPSDFSKSFETYTEEKPFGVIDKEVLDVLKILIKKYPNLKVMAIPYSPPGYMKDSGTIAGGELLQEYELDYVQYLIDYINILLKNGIKNQNVSLMVGNEPTVDNFLNKYPTTRMTDDQQLRLAKELKALLPWLKIIGYNDSADPEKQKRTNPYNFIGYPFDGIGVHGYSSVGYDTRFLPTEKPILCSESTEMYPHSKRDYLWAIRNLHNCLNNNIVGFSWLNGLLDQNHGPFPTGEVPWGKAIKSGGCKNCTGIYNFDTSKIDPKGNYPITESPLSILLNRTRDIKEGTKIVRLYANLQNGELSSNVLVSSYSNDNGKLDIIITNTAEKVQKVTVRLSKGKFINVTLLPLQVTIIKIPWRP